MNANKGVFGVNLGHMWGEVERLRGWAADSLICGGKASSSRRSRRASASMKHHLRITLFKTARISAKCCWCRKTRSASVQRQRARPKPRSRISQQ